MSTEAGELTRDRILTAAFRLIEQDKDGPVSMVAIAKAAGLSRQALYLNFSDKTDLYIALVRWVDQRRGINAEYERIANASDGVTALELLIEAEGRLNPKLRSIATAMDILRRNDPAADRAWQDRFAARAELCGAVIQRIAEEGRLRCDVDRDTARDMLLILSGFHAWDNLVNLLGWSTERYITQVTAIAKAWLVAPSPPEKAVAA